MSRENVEVVQAIVDADVAGDIESFKSLLAPDVEWKQVEEPEAAHGLDAALAAVERWGRRGRTLKSTSASTSTPVRRCSSWVPGRGGA
jgi:hypothetical protein